ncbi:hypothetical protein K2173_005464 [Erythroxylum novogranatense]|uniref:Alpha-mannosidase n=1 Tax=Erythroxylum novogranatense TaxID=1862640 RepID=A0AAV8SK29_9ROSI|nr:hypothetical protein K2173_005464 [Erythroxylum novogranatense]
MAIQKWFPLFLLLVHILCVQAKYIAYNTSSRIVPGKINVHLVPHSHDDVGWLKTIDQYYVGSNNSIQAACVKNILDSLIPALLADRNRKFVYVEQAFFQRWWREQNKKIQNKVRKLVRSSQLELINGGICMHDEATAHYIDMIDQTTLGHRFIKQEFNVTPRIGWQVDPFGHSAVQAYLLGAQVGFDSLFFGRIDYQDRIKRKNEKSLEVVWRGSKTFGSSAQIFADAFPEGYGAPGNFYYEVNTEGFDSPIVQDDTDLFDYNVPERVNEFVSAAMTQANITRTDHIMFTMGTDFQYHYAETWFTQMDKLINYVNQDGRVNALYSTPSIYTDAKHSTKESWPLKTDDYFPYADKENAYWTGYFTSRPALKGYVRKLSGYYLAARQLEFFKGFSKAGPNMESLADALAIVQHHDAVAGTEKQHVANDYATRLSKGHTEAEKAVGASLSCIVDSSLKTGCINQVNKFQQCPLLNISYCPASEVHLSNGKSLVVVVYNSLGWKKEDVIRFPVINENVMVKDSRGNRIESQVLPLLDASIGIRNYYSKSYLGISPNVTPKYWLAFSASVPPLGFNTYIISSATSIDKQGGMHAATSDMQNLRTESPKTDGVQIGPGNLKLIYSRKEGNLNMYINRRRSVKTSLEQVYGYYAAYGATKNHTQASGAYIFRPNGSYPIEFDGKVDLTILRGPLLHEAHQRINSWIYQVTRLYKGKEHAEFEFTVGPIPIDDGIGKEIITKIITTTKSNKRFYTDSNGRDFIERVRDYRKDWDLRVNQPVAGNYYPVNLGMYMKDNTSEVSILVDRVVGGSSIVDGQLEIMVHRRLIKDDRRGVSEALNETVCVHNECTGLTIVGKYYLRIDPVGEGAKWRRSYGQEIYSPFLLAFAEQDGDHWTKSNGTKFSGMDSSYVLPDNVAIITLQELEDRKVLLRLAHLYEIGEDKDLSNMARVELKRVFPFKKVNKITETNLSANQERAEMEKKRLVWKVEGDSGEEPEVVRGGPVDPETLIVELSPMEIRTFLVEFASK